MDFFQLRAAMIGAAVVETTHQVYRTTISGKITAIIYRRDEKGKITCSAEIAETGTNSVTICSPEKIKIKERI